MSAELATYRVLDASGTEVNTVLWDGTAPFDLPEGWSLQLVEAPQ